MCYRDTIVNGQVAEENTQEDHEMVRLFVRHMVNDYATWKQAYDDFDAERSGMGVTGHAVYQQIDNPNDVTVTHDFGSTEQAQAFIESARLKEVMADAGVAGPPDAWLTAAA